MRKWLPLLLVPLVASCDLVGAAYRREANAKNLSNCVARPSGVDLMAACTAVIEDDVLNSEQWRIIARRERARLLIAAGNEADALRDFRVVLAAGPDPASLLSAAKILVGQGEYDAAESLLQQSITLYDSGIARELMGGISLNRGDYLAARDYFTIAFDRTNQQSGLALRGRATARQCLGDQVGALEDRAGAERLSHSSDDERIFWEDGKCVGDGT